MSTLEHLPPLMGFPQEEYHEGKSMVPFYTCVIGPFRVYVFSVFNDPAKGWRIERCTRQVSKNAAEQFMGNAATSWTMDHTDPVALLGIIHRITTEGPDEELEALSDASGADDSIPSLDLAARCAPAVTDWE